ncbi:MAG TPA: efflux RND transporter periplasmic adaptor subunit [Verrucomicrobiae bacterium]|jgi:HlyD family secretion protein|nr:efflux RND transporter periplasmic adaptor subunit [Verrucomicrobiae bacterium]
MKAKKIVIIVAIVLVLGVAIVGFTVNTQKNVISVQTGKVVRQDIASTVTASGEVKPKTFVNVGANAQGRITHLFVAEGQKVKKGQILAQLDNIQPSAGLSAMQAALSSSQTDAVSSEAAFKTAQAQLNSSRADCANKKLTYDRQDGLYKAQLISKADYDAAKAAYEVSTAAVAHDEAVVAQAKANVDSAHGHITQAHANMATASDVLSKTTYPAPFDGVVTYVPVHEGETVVQGIQNSPGSTLMTVADMSVITAEVRVDETDIVNVAMGQSAEVTIDAIPGKTFHGQITEIGDNAIVRSTGLATTQSTASSQEAKDFKVVITLSDPPANVRPGLSATAKITTGTSKQTLSIPIQALTIRDKDDLEAQTKKGPAPAASTTPTTPAKKEKVELQGVFVIRNKKAEFQVVKTGLTGTTEIEVKDGLKDGDEIITGSYKVLRTLRNGASVKVDNSVAAKTES